MSVITYNGVAVDLNDDYTDKVQIVNGQPYAKEANFTPTPVVGNERSWTWTE